MRTFILLATALSFATPVFAQQKASFLDGTYVFADGACEKLKALAAGGPQSISTVPWYVTPDGISFWEGGCQFSEISKGQNKDEWNVVASCEEAVDEYTETYIFRRTSPTSFDVSLTSPGTSDAAADPVRYTRCDVGKIADPQ